MRSPQWMIAYALVLVLVGAAYAALVYVNASVAFVFALLALVAMVGALALVIFK